MPLSGNRFYLGTATFGEQTLEPAGIDEPGWVLGSAASVDESERTRSGVLWLSGSDDAGPFEVSVSADGTPVRQPVDHLLPASDRHVPDTRIVSNGEVSVELIDPTDRYPHGALGDNIEAATIRIVRPGATIDIELADDDVVEGTAAMLADLDDDGTDEVIVTLANASGGARLAAFDLDGGLVAQSEPIGQGNRWRHQIAVGPTGPNGEVELVVVRTPHIGGIVEWFQLRDGRLDVVARYPDGDGQRVTSHPIRTINLDLAAVFDTTGDSRPELVVPSHDKTRLLVLGRTAESAEVLQSIPLPAEITSNLAVVEVGDGTLVVGFGLSDGSIISWG